MLYPQNNPCRQVIDLSGLWNFQPDPNGIGVRDGWFNSLPGPRPIAVPASWNDQYADLQNYLGDSWYQIVFDRPWGWSNYRLLLRFGSVNYVADVWLNGQFVNTHEGGHLPFELDITRLIRASDNTLAVRVNGELSMERVPPGNVQQDSQNSFMNEDYPAANFDFFPYCGIHRPVQLVALHPAALTDMTITTGLDGQRGMVGVRVLAPNADGSMMRFALGEQRGEITITGPETMAEFVVPDVIPWSPANPHLYPLSVELVQHGQTVDCFSLPVGIRTVAVQGDQLLLNGEPIRLRGFGRHEDFPLAGRGYSPATLIKDFDLMRWVGANSFRTSHYPYSEQQMMLADRLGLLVIDETPAVGLFFHEEGLEARMTVWRQQVRDLIARDKNHPSVIMWSLANEPHTARPAARDAFREIFELAQSLDSTRPLTLASYRHLDEPAWAFADAICLNIYFGWYSEAGRLEAGFDRLASLLDTVHDRFKRPIIVSEFGADAIPGMHANPPQMFSEEYQAVMIEGYLRVMDTRPYVVGQHIWNLCDFKTGQSVRRVGALNHKGIFTRLREPKLAAHRVRALWTENG